MAQTLARAGWKVSARSVRRIGRERHGQGPAVGRLGIVQRFASTENIFATARLERFWRTLKDTSGIRLQPPLTIKDLERRLEMTLSHYVLFRPHQGYTAPPRPKVSGHGPGLSSRGVTSTRSAWGGASRCAFRHRLPRPREASLPVPDRGVNRGSPTRHPCARETCVPALGSGGLLVARATSASRPPVTARSRGPRPVSTPFAGLPPGRTPPTC